MQKKLIALAVAGLASSAAFAQSNVTIYGTMDTTWECMKSSGATDGTSNISSRSRLSSNSSNIGFKGSESLGNGLTAVFQYESGIGSDEAGAMAGGRDTLVGIAGSFGTIAAGNLTGPVRAIGAAVDFNPGATSSGFTASMYGEVAGLKTGVDERSKNTIAYISPTFAGGLYGVVAYQNGTPAADGASVNKDSRLYTLGLVYANGPIFAGFGYINAKNPGVAHAVVSKATGLSDADLETAMPGVTAALNDVTNTTDKLVDYRLAGKYTFPFGLSLAALWDSQKYTVNSTVLSTEAKRNAYMLGANQNFGANNIWLQYAVAKDLSGSFCDGGGCGETGAKQWTLGYSYSLSKRTMLHAFYTRITNEKDVAYDHYVNAVGNNAAGADSSVYGGGLRHTF